MTTFIHGKTTVVKLATKDLSAYTNNTQWKRSADSHDTTAYGADSHAYAGGLKDGTVTISGTFDNTAVSGPAAAIEALLGTTAAFIYQAEGTGVGKQQRSCNVVVTSYEQTAPVADMVTWTADLQISGSVNETPQ